MNVPHLKTIIKTVLSRGAWAAPRYSWVAEVHLPSQGRTQGQSWKKQEEERSHLQKRRALAGMMNYVYSKRSKEQHASSCHAHSRQRGSNSGSTSHPRPDTLHV